MPKKILVVLLAMVLSIASLWFLSGPMIADAEQSDANTIIKDNFKLSLSPVEGGEANEIWVVIEYSNPEKSEYLSPYFLYVTHPEGRGFLEPKVQLDDAKGFLLQRVEGFPGLRAEGEIQPGGRFRARYKAVLEDCPNGDSSCIFTIKSALEDEKGNRATSEVQFKYVEPENDQGNFSLDMNLIGAGQIGGTLNMDVQLKLGRDGGTDPVNGNVLITFPDDWAISSVEDVELKTLKAIAGEPSFNGQKLSIPIEMGPDGVTLVGFGTWFEGDCPNPECQFTMWAEWQPESGESIKTSKEISFENEDPSPADEIFIACCFTLNTVAAGENVPVEFRLFNPPATADQAGEYKFLLEVSGLVNTGKLEMEFTEAGPDKVVFEPDQKVLKWAGTVGEGGQIRERAWFKADFCENGNSCAADARLTVLLPNGSKVVRSDTLLIEDTSGFDPDLVKLKAAIWSGEKDDRPESIEDFDDLPYEAACGTECQQILIGIKNGNEQWAETFIQLTGKNNLKLRPSAGVQMRLLKEDKEAGTKTYQIRAITGSDLQVLGITAQIDGVIEDDLRETLTIKHCSQQVGAQTCQGEKESEGRSLEDLLTLFLIWQLRDYGDAASRHNHSGFDMEAYPGEGLNAIGNFPVSDDPVVAWDSAYGAHGPAHRWSNYFHLGAGVTPEFDVDRYWDADGTNNIDPILGIDQADFDGYDDGVDISQITFVDCESIDIPVEVTITPQAISWFQTQEDRLAYINIWLDSDRDGHWGIDNITSCNSLSPVLEHIVIDAIVDPIALGVGTHTVTVNAPLVGWSDINNGAYLDNPAWMRVMLSPIPSNKDLYITYGDGRGEDFPYFGGETEDYYYVPPAGLASGGGTYGADMTLDVELGNPGIFSGMDVTDFIGKRGTQGEMVIRFRNDGYEAAEDIEVIAELPKSIIEFGSFSLLNCDGCTEEVAIQDGLGTFKIDRLEPGEFGKVTLGWTGCLTCVRDTDESLAQAQIFVRSKADFRPENNTRLFEGWPVKSRLAPQVTLGWHGCLTCTRSVDNSLIPDAYNFLFETRNPDVTHLRQYVNGEQVGEDQEMCDGIPCKDLGFVIANGGGLGVTTFTYIDKDGKESPPSDPIELRCENDIVQGSLTFTNVETGQQRRVPADKHITSPGDVPMVVMSGGSTMLATVMYCGDDPTPELSLKIGDKDYTFSQLKEGDVIYEVKFLLEIEGRKPTSPILLSVESNGTTYEDEFLAAQPAQGAVTAGATQLPVSDAKVLVLTEQTTEFDGDEVTVMAPWDGSAAGQSNPVSTEPDGSYSLSVPNGRYQLVVIADGYQSYRSSVMEVTNGQIASTVELVEARPAPSNININIDAAGFSQSFVEVEAGWVVKFINSGTAAHGAASDAIGETSGLMAPGESFKMAFETVGTYTIVDPANPINSMTIIVVESTSGPDGSGISIFLPMIQR